MNIFTPLRNVLRNYGMTSIWTVFILGVTPPAANAYVLEGFQWPAGQTIVLDLQLGTPTGTLIDGSTTWDQVAEAAAGIWNPYLGSNVQLQTQETNFTPAQGDGRNSVFFATSVYGEGFGDDTLATTVNLYNPDTHVTLESDVIFNSAVPYNSYRGPLRTNGTQQVFDLRRVALHEFGHVLGLAHVPQSTQAIMTPVTTDIDTIQPDDIAGVESIYGTPGPVAPAINGGLSDGGLVGEDFEYQIGATNNPTSYSASSLPPGLSVNGNSGLISGTPTTAGTYDVTIGATNSAGTGTATLTLVFGYKPVITSALDVTAYVGKAFYYQITASGQAISYTVSNGGPPDGLSYDPSTALISGIPLKTGTYGIPLVASGPTDSDYETLELTVAYDATLTVLQSFVGSGPGLSYPSALFGASDGNFYGAASGGGAYSSGAVFKLAPDGTLTSLYNFDYPGISAPLCLLQAPDSSFYGTTRQGGANGGGTVFELAADGTLTVVGSFATPPTGFANLSSVLLGSDGNFYGTIRFGETAGNDQAGIIYKLTPDGTLTTLHQFDGGDGFYPSALIQASDGNFYGTTYRGGSGNYGTVFRVTPDGTFTILHSFAATEGSYPLAPLIEATDGNFYGTTAAAENGSGDGTVFRVTPDGTLTTVHDFVDAEGKNPLTALVQGSDGNFYGPTAGNWVEQTGTLPATIFMLTPDGALTKIHTFANADGAPAFLPLVADGAGNFYGGAVSGGSGNEGTLFKVTPNAVVPVYAPPPVVVPTITLTAVTPEVAVNSGGYAAFSLTLSAAQTTDVIANFTIKGTALNGTDYVLLTGTKKIKAGKLSKPIKIIPQGDLDGASKKTVVLTLQSGDGYTVGTTNKVKVKIVAP